MLPIEQDILLVMLQQALAQADACGDGLIGALLAQCVELRAVRIGAGS